MISNPLDLARLNWAVRYRVLTGIEVQGYPVQREIICATMMHRDLRPLSEFVHARARIIFEAAEADAA